MERSVYEYFDDSADVAPSLLVQPPAGLPIAETQGAAAPSAKELAMWRWANVDNLDLFLQDVYQYFLDKGFYCVMLKRVFNMLTVLFVVVFSTYLGHCIDYSKLRHASRLSDVRVARCLARTSLGYKLVLWGFGALWCIKCAQYAQDVRRLLELKAFYEHLLNVDENEIQTISWQQVVNRIAKLSNINLEAAGRAATRPQKPLDPHNVANRIMRKENYVISLLNKNILDLNVTLPFYGQYEFLTKTLEWSINLCIIDFVFDSRGKLRPVFLDETKRRILSDGLKQRFRFAAILNILLAPFAIIYMCLYYFFRYFNEYHRDPSTMGTRQYTPLAEWKLRELNELYHLFTRRLGMSTIPAIRYISQFPRQKMDTALRFLVFVCSAFAAVLGFASIYDPELLGFEISPDKTVLFYIGIFGTGIAVARGMIALEPEIFDPEAAMRQIVEFTHYLPESWEDSLHTEKVKVEFCKMYDLKIKILLRDICSLFINPIILWYNLPDSSDRIVDFFREFSIHVDDLGYVCSFAVFNFDQARKVKARAESLDKYYASDDGKMLKSYLNFMDIYGPPSARGLGRRYDPTAAHSSFQGSQSSSSLSHPDLSQSVMSQFDRLKQLPSVSEENDEEANGANVSNDSHEGFTGELDILPEESPSDYPAKKGVFGILNQISKVEGRRMNW